MILRILIKVKFLLYKFIIFIVFKYTHKFNQFNKGKSLTFDQIINGHNSFLRWGDGETELLLGRSIYFQRSNFHISYGLLSILLSRLFNNQHNFFLGFPSNESIENSACFNETKKLMSIIGVKSGDFDANILRNCYFSFFDFIKYLPSKSLLIAGNELGFHILHNKLSLIGKKLELAKVPSCNSFESVMNLMSTIPWDDYECIVISAGPAGKILGHELINKGYLVWDIGHGLDSMAKEILAS